MTSIPWLEPGQLAFPEPATALKRPNGLLAGGGDLSADRLILAYRSGIFPWYDAGQPILWWSPDPRMVLVPGQVKLSRSLKKRLRRNEFQLRINTAFEEVVDACAAPRSYAEDTWITPEMRAAYCALHQQGFAHSIECFQADDLVGGLYGVSIGRLFFGESMFHRATDASKVAFAHLCRWLEAQQCPLIDCQIENDHLVSLGCQMMSRDDFLECLAEGRNQPAMAWPAPVRGDAAPVNLLPSWPC